MVFLLILELNRFTFPERKKDKMKHSQEKLQSEEINEETENSIKNLEIGALNIYFNHFEFLKTYEANLHHILTKTFINKNFSFKAIIIEFVLPFEMVKLNSFFNKKAVPTDLLVVSKQGIATIYFDLIFIALCVSQEIIFDYNFLEGDLINRIIEVLIYSVIKSTNLYSKQEILELTKKNLILGGYLHE